jgi:elongation of very long chain fatty acids protein 6
MGLIKDVIVYVNEFDASKLPIFHDYGWALPIGTLIVYLGIVFYLPRRMEKEDKIEFLFVMRLWNLFLSILSLLTFMGMVTPVVAFILDKGFYELVCLPGGELYRGSQMFWAWVFAIAKHLELLDTLFLVLRKKPVAFLHYYHHITVLAYTMVNIHFLPGGLAFLFATINSAIHTVMYWYYYRALTSRPPRWAPLIHRAQLTQMLVGAIVSLCWCYYYLVGWSCSCKYPIIYALGSVILYGSYFILYLQFFTVRFLRRFRK